jgi:photosystem II stability/assembly factor-like uncharacterized protein
MSFLISVVFSLIAVAPLAYGQSLALRHVHGLAYSSDGKRLMIPSHHGLAVYENGKWSKAPGPQHDYMGFSATAKHLYSSGHPAPGSGLVNPFGVIRSKDGGKTWDKLGLEGETDFHLLAAGWNTDVIYVWNPAPSSRLKQPGLHYTLNDGRTWKAARAEGLAGEPRALAVHPDDPGIVALATSAGLFVSSDSGEHFSKGPSEGQGLSVFFDLNGEAIWFGGYADRPTLERMPLNSDHAMYVPLPALTNDAVAYIAQSPSRKLEYAIATFERSVYLSNDGGKSWKQIANRGTAR